MPGLKRRQVITLLGGVATAWPLVVHAQLQPKMLRVGFVGMQPREFPLYTTFLKRMAELGYQEGRNFAFEYIQTPDIEGYEKNYRDLAARKVDVFLAVGNEPALRAALSAADGRPIAFLAVDFDPLAKGYVASLSHPGGNVTGIFVRQLELAAKRVEIAREAFPRATVVGIAFDTVSREQRDTAAEAAHKLGLEQMRDLNLCRRRHVPPGRNYLTQRATECGMPMLGGPANGLRYRWRADIGGGRTSFRRKRHQRRKRRRSVRSRGEQQIAGNGGSPGICGPTERTCADPPNEDDRKNDARISAQ
jgi:hypothetical protein